MNVPRTLALAALAGGSTLLVGQGTALADCTPTAYSNNCVTTPGTDVAPTTEVKGTRFVDDTAGSLPFTGGETALLAAVGAGVLAGGLGLTVAGRRRTAAAEAD